MPLEIFCSSGGTFLLFLWYWAYYCIGVSLSIHWFFYFSRQETSYIDTEIFKNHYCNNLYIVIFVSKGFRTRNLFLKIYPNRKSFQIYLLFDDISTSLYSFLLRLPLLFSFVELNLRSTPPQNFQITFHSAFTVPIYYFCLAVKETRFGNYVFFLPQAYTDFPFYISFFENEVFERVL